MKKSLLVTILSIGILLCIASCKKKTDVAPANTISATIGGTDETFNSNISAGLGTGVELNSNLLITATNGTSANADAISIGINSNTTITTGTYTSSAANKISFPALLYTKGPFSLVNPLIYSTDVNDNYSTTITITALTSTNIQGTFNGTLLFTDGTTTKTVTNGKFNVTLN